jgi:hypothetical protein
MKLISHKHLASTGYRLAFQRLRDTRINKESALYSKYKESAEKPAVMRTIKYPLVAESEYIDPLYEAVLSDYSTVSGIYKLGETKEYSLVDFWRDAIRVGGIFQPTKSDIFNFYMPEDRFIQSIKPEIRGYIAKPREFISFLMKDLREPEEKTKQQIFDSLKKTVEERN